MEDSPLIIDQSVHPTSFSIPEWQLYLKIDTFPDAEIPDLTTHVKRRFKLLTRAFLTFFQLLIKFHALQPPDTISRHDFGSNMKWEKIRGENLSVDYGILLSEEQCLKYLTLLESEIQYYEGDLARVKVFGKWHPIPRQQVAFGDRGLAYRFSGNRIPAKEWTNTISELKTTVENATGFSYNFVLVNRYRDGNSYIGEHRDDEDEIDKNIPIASLSLGACREFQFKHVDRKKRKRRTDLPVVKKMLENGSLLLMNPPTNSYWYHSLPKRSGCKSLRINLTFRNIISPAK